MEPAGGLPLQKGRHARHHGGQSALHVGRAPAPENAVIQRRVEGGMGPGLLRSRRHHIGMARKAEDRASVPRRA
jgi:hypothetical protein